MTRKIKFAPFSEGVGRGAERKIVQNAFFHGKRHDNKISKVKMLLSRDFVVMAQAPNNLEHFDHLGPVHLPAVLQRLLVRGTQGMVARVRLQKCFVPEVFLLQELE